MGLRAGGAGRWLVGCGACPGPLGYPSWPLCVSCAHPVSLGTSLLRYFLLWTITSVDLLNPCGTSHALDILQCNVVVTPWLSCLAEESCGHWPAALRRPSVTSLGYRAVAFGWARRCTRSLLRWVPSPPRLGRVLVHRAQVGWLRQWAVELNSHIVRFPFWLSHFLTWFWGSPAGASSVTAGWCTRHRGIRHIRPT